MTKRRWLILAAICVGAALTQAEEPAYKVEITDASAQTGDILLPLDPTVRMQIGHGGNIHFGLMVNNIRITCSPQGSVWPTAQIDGRVMNPANQGAPVQVGPLLTLPGGKARNGFFCKWTTNDLEFEQIVEVIPSKPAKSEPGGRRMLDTARMSYVVTNKGKTPREVAMRTNLDILVNNNDGALYASPVTEPGKILNGVTLQGKTLPPYIQVLERPDVKDPGFVATMSFKLGNRVEGPSKVVLTQLGALGAANWDVAAMAAGDSACAIYWDTKTLKPGERREMVWAYGGGIATNPDSEGKVSLSLAGSLEPGKLFSLAVLIEDPILGQNLRLDLPAGIERVEGNELQPVLLPGGAGNSIVLWKARVLRPGNYDLKVHSSTGATQIKSVSIQPLGAR